MSIKPDHWIRKMALEQQMIDPFEEKLVRAGVISYGLSSFGYDIRVASEFRIFTASTGQLTVVDPKTLDERAMFAYEGEICIIPPNSFALARSVEYFRMPRNVMGLCLGKCVSGDTRVVDAETGAYRPIRDWTNAQRTVGLQGWKMQIADINRHIPQGRKPVFLLTTKAGLKIRATANHPFRKLHGWTALSDLQIGDRIAIAREIPVFGKTPIPDWEAALLGLMISEGQCDTPQHSPTFTSSDPVLVSLLGAVVSEGGLGTITYRGRYGYRLVNHAGRGGIAESNRASQWLTSYALNVTAEHKFVPEAIFTAPKESVQLFLQTLFAGDGSVYRNGESYFVEYYSKSRRLIEDVHHLLLRFGIFSLIREKTTQVQTQAYKIQITDREQILRFATQIGFYPGSIKQKRLEDEIFPALQEKPLRARSNFDTLPNEAWSLVREAAVAGEVKLRGVNLRSEGIKVTSRQSLPIRVATKIAALAQCSYLESLANGPIWDVVQSIEAAGEEEVFDLSVPDLHNFVANDMIVHNSTYARSGIVTNFTPFEPGWEGHVTIEISNTTPLPAKIYANEGIAQVLFFEGEQPEVSYADRNGKYQAQTGITLPKV